MRKDKLVEKLIKDEIASAFKEAYGSILGGFPTTEEHNTLLNNISKYIYEKYAKKLKVEDIKKAHGIK